MNFVRLLWLLLTITPHFVSPRRHEKRESTGTGSGEGKPARHRAPMHGGLAQLEKRDSNHFFKAQLVEERAQAIMQTQSFGRPKGMRARAIAREVGWRCCPADWFTTKNREVDAEVYFLRPYKTGASTLQGLLWTWAISRHIPLLSHPRDMNRTDLPLVAATAPVAFAAHMHKTSSEQGKHRGARLYDARLTLRDYERVARFRAHGPQPSRHEPVYVALLRDPLARAVATFYGAHRQPESIATARRTSPRLWRRESRGSFSKEHLAHIALFAAQKGSSRRFVQALYRIEPLWVFFAPQEWADNWHEVFNPLVANEQSSSYEADSLPNEVDHLAAAGPIAAATELRRLHMLVSKE